MGEDFIPPEVEVVEFWDEVTASTESPIELPKI